MIEASLPQRPGHKARLISRAFEPTTKLCRMTFYYHMLGDDMGQLNVYVRFFSNGPLQKIYGVSGNVESVSLVISIHPMCSLLRRTRQRMDPT